MNVLIIDAQGGGLGKQLVVEIKKKLPEATVIAIGANSTATTAMLKAGADKSATGENALIVACRNADVILGPVGIVVADALLGEITPRMAAAVGQSSARRILVPFNQCETVVVGVSERNMSSLVQQAVDELCNFTKNGERA